MRKYLNRMKASGACPPRKPLHKIVWSWLGAFLGILLILLIERSLSLTSQEGLFLIGSFGASAALVGITVFMVMGDSDLLVGPIAVSLAVVAMHFTRTLHPPGGATALIAIIGGDKIQSLGYWYALSPVLLSSIVLLIVALLVNNISNDTKRHYPVYWW